MATLDRVVPPRAFRVSTMITAVIAGWFALTFAVTVGAMVVGA
jgi:hypothetical protein